MAGYSTPNQIREATGVQFDDFKLQNSGELDTLLERWIGYVAGLIDDQAEVETFFDDPGSPDIATVPQSIRSVSERAMSRWVQQVRSHRDAALIRLDEWRIGINLVDEVLPDHMRDDIDRHMKARARGRVPHGFRGFVAHGADDHKEESDGES